MVVSALRNELKARNVNSKGLKSQLVARLAKALKVEAEKAEDPSKEVQQEVDFDTSADEKKVEVGSSSETEKRNDFCYDATLVGLRWLCKRVVLFHCR